MSYRLQSVVLVVTLLWHALSMVNPFAGASRADQFAHLVVSSQDEVLAAHADRSQHQNASPALDKHLHPEEGLMLAGLILMLALAMPSQPQADPVAAQSPCYSPPSLDGLLRPPMAGLSTRPRHALSTAVRWLPCFLTPHPARARLRG